MPGGLQRVACRTTILDLAMMRSRRGEAVILVERVQRGQWPALVANSLSYDTRRLAAQLGTPDATFARALP
jgi:hypothetical protein